MNYVYHPHTPHSPNLIHPPHQHCCQPHTTTLPQQTHLQHKQQYTHHSHSNHPIHTGYDDKLTDRPKTTTYTTQGYRSSSKSERNLIILHISINGIKNKLEELKLLIHDTHADIITIQETKFTQKPKHPKYINSQQCEPIGCTRQGVGSLHSLETTLHSLQQTYLQPSIHTRQNFKWSRYT